MTEAEWLACDDPQVKLEILRGKASERKLRLFACARCRSLWHQMTDERSRKAVDVAERLAEGTATEQERIAAFVASNAAASKDEYSDPEEMQTYLAAMAAAYAYHAVWEDAYDAAHADAPSILLGSASSADLLPDHQFRDIFGNPFHPVSFHPAWRTVDVMLLARGIYDDRAFDRLPILADALQDAGCDSADLLNHLRDTAAPHVHGCWAIDLVLGKE